MQNKKELNLFMKILKISVFKCYQIKINLYKKIKDNKLKNYQKYQVKVKLKKLIQMIVDHIYNNEIFIVYIYIYI